MSLFLLRLLFVVFVLRNLWSLAAVLIWAFCLHLLFRIVNEKYRDDLEGVEVDGNRFGVEELLLVVVTLIAFFLAFRLRSMLGLA